MWNKWKTGHGKRRYFQTVLRCYWTCEQGHWKCRKS